MRYLVEKGSIAQSEFDRLGALLDTRNGPLTLVPLDRAVTQALGQISRDIVPDMPDRIIAATALHLDIPLVTHDYRIRGASIRTVW